MELNLLVDNNNAKPAAGRPATDRPAGVPGKFWDAAQGTIRTDALLKSYQELERKLSRSVDPANKPHMMKVLGVPETADGYNIKCPHGFFEADASINHILHDKSFTEDQAQTVYDLAAERLVPMILDIAQEFSAEHEQDRLIEQFGGDAQWREISRQLLMWAKAHLPEEAVKGLSTTYQGVMALYKMMQNDEPTSLKPDGTARGADDINDMVKDPRYWQQKDPAYIAEVTAAFKRRYNGQL